MIVWTLRELKGSNGQTGWILSRELHRDQHPDDLSRVGHGDGPAPLLLALLLSSLELSDAKVYEP